VALWIRRALACACLLTGRACSCLPAVRGCMARPRSLRGSLSLSLSPTHSLSLAPTLSLSLSLSLTHTQIEQRRVTVSDVSQAVRSGHNFQGRRHRGARGVQCCARLACRCRHPDQVRRLADCGAPAALQRRRGRFRIDGGVRSDSFLLMCVYRLSIINVKETFFGMSEADVQFLCCRRWTSTMCFDFR